MIEVEKKAITDESVNAEVKKRLAQMGAADLGENNTTSYFFLLEKQQLKLQVQDTKKTAKIAWKSGDFDGSSAREEIEVVIPLDQVENSEKLITRLVPDAKIVKTIQKRHDYAVGKLTIAVKWSENWGFHIELDTNVETNEDVAHAQKELAALANELGVTLMSEQEEKAFVEAILQKINRGS